MKTLLRTTSLLILTIWLSNPSQAQNYSNKTNIGFGLRELSHIGFDHRIRNYSIGADIGSSFPFFDDGTKYLTLTIDYTLFFGKPGFFEMKTFYVSPRIIYFRTKDNSSKCNAMLFSPVIGKEFNFDERIGVNIDVGAAFRVFSIWEFESMYGSGTIHPIFPVLRIQFYYRFSL